MTEQLLSWDRSLFLILNGSDSLFWDGFMWKLTQTATWIPLMLVFAYVIMRNSDLKTFLLTIAFAGLLVLLTDQVSSSFAKAYFQRFRPTHDPELSSMVDIVNGYRGGLYGFFSSHAANTFGIAMFLSLIFRRTGLSLVLYAYAILCSYSRIYLGVHFPGDILAGAVFGTLAGLLVFLLYHYLMKRLGLKSCCPTDDALVSRGGVSPDLVIIVFSLTLCYAVYAAARVAVHASLL